LPPNDVSVRCAPGRYRPLLRSRRLAAKRFRVPHRLKLVACFNQPAAECCSFYAFVSRRLRRAATLITSGYPACRIFAVSRPGRFMLQISPIHASRSYQGQSGSPFDVTIWSFADQTCFSRSSESSRDGSFSICRTSASCLSSRLPRPLALAFPPDFRSPDNAVSDRLVLRLRSWLAPSPQHPGTATSHSSLRPPSGLRSAPPATRVPVQVRGLALTKQSCLPSTSPYYYGEMNRPAPA
jgi:hypothetical protein